MTSTSSSKGLPDTATDAIAMAIVNGQDSKKVLAQFKDRLTPANRQRVTQRVKELKTFFENKRRNETPQEREMRRYGEAERQKLIESIPYEELGRDK